MALLLTAIFLFFLNHLAAWSGIGTLVSKTFPSTRIRCRFQSTARANQRQSRRSEDVRAAHGAGRAGRFPKGRKFYRKSCQWYVGWVKWIASHGAVTVAYFSFADGLMDGYLSNQDYKATWSLQETVNSEKRPGMRGGHQLIIDSANSVMYLYGGWDGFEDLSDLWSYSIKRNSWTLIHQRSEEKEGPSPRSCHKMVYDPCNSQIFTLGRYMDSSTRTKEHIKVPSCTEFDSNGILITPFFHFAEWFLLVRHKNEDLAADLRRHESSGWPKFDFRSSDVHRYLETEYLRIRRSHFGATIPWRSIKWAIVLWTLLLPHRHQHMDTNSSRLCSSNGIQSRSDEHQITCHPLDAIPSRTYAAPSTSIDCFIPFIIFSAFLLQRHRKLYIFGGQRNKEYTTDFISYDVDTQNVAVVNTENMKSEKNNVPQSGFTQRATIDCERDEIYVLSVSSAVNQSIDRMNVHVFVRFPQSLSKDKERREINLNSFWMYSLKTNQWSCIYKTDHSNDCYSKVQSTCTEPCPRYAHQLVYDWINKVHYLFGGNPGRNLTPQLRLDDFWILHLKK